MDNNSTILIADDEEAGRETVESLLAPLGYNIIFANDGFSALEQARRHTPDLLLLDIMMPNMDGFEVCRHLRADSLLGELPIIMLTALDDADSRRQGLEAGADDFVTKPFDRAELRARVRTIIRLNRYRRLLQADGLIREQATLLDIAQDAIIVHDLAECILFWNKSAERLYGFTVLEAKGKKLCDLVRGQDPIQLTEAYKQLFEKGAWSGELQQVTREGKDIIVETRWTLVSDREDQPKSIFIVNTDVTEKKRIEAQFLRAQRLENIGALTSGIAHDLNNILAPILMSVQLLKRKTNDKQISKLIDTVELSAGRGADLIKQILSFSRGIESTKTLIQPRHLILEIMKVAQETFPRLIEVSCHAPTDIWPISFNATQLHQILMNLSVNARDAMPNGGALSITAKNIILDDNHIMMNGEAKAGPYVVITVSDTGTGIATELREKIFEPFFTTKAPGKGTGLGLSTVLSIVKSQGGFLQINSRVNEGSEFVIYLPANVPATICQAVEPESELIVGDGTMVLVIDDESSIREIIKSSLEAYNYQVVAAGNGVEAIGLYASHRDSIQVVITDIMMPRMDGEATIRALKQMQPNIKIIAISGLSPTGIDIDVLNDVWAFLPKPFTAKALLSTLREVLKSNHN
ncbi:MAG: response regulator [Acidobacteriota bacterium]